MVMYNYNTINCCTKKLDAAQKKPQKINSKRSKETFNVLK